MAKKATQRNKVKVLYQNLGGVWYAFAQAGDDIYFGRVPMNVSPETAFQLLKAQQKAPETKKKAPRRTSRRAPAKSAT